MKFSLFLNLVTNILLGSTDQNQENLKYDFLDSYFIKNLYWQKVVYYLIVLGYYILRIISRDYAARKIFKVITIVNLFVIFIDIYYYNLTVPIAICTYMHLIIIFVISLAVLAMYSHELEQDRRSLISDSKL